MKVLYLASKAIEAESLALVIEITRIQRNLVADSAEPPQFIFLPDIMLEEVPIEITRHKPDILHISVHGNEAGLEFSTGDGRTVSLTAEQLAAFLPRDRMPKLIFLNACNSKGIAAALSKQGLVAIGTKSPITNGAGIGAASLLYDRLLHGYTLRQAFDAVAALVNSFEGGETGLVLETSDSDLADRTLVSLPLLAAKLTDDRPHFASGNVRVKLGFAGCPATTTQVCFFTDDPSFIENEEEDDLENDLTEVVRDIPRGGEIWIEGYWEVDGDCRVAACGITGTGATFSASGRLSDVLEAYAASVQAPPKYTSELATVVKFLRKNDGSGLADWVAAKPRANKRRHNPAKAKAAG